MSRNYKTNYGGFIAPYSNNPSQNEYNYINIPSTSTAQTVQPAQTVQTGQIAQTGQPVQIYTPPSATPVTTVSPVTTATPGLKGGNESDTTYVEPQSNIELDDEYLYSLEGGCACNVGGKYKNNCNAKRGGNQIKKGGDVVLTPFISALALLGARLLADKNSGFNMRQLFEDNSNETLEQEYRRGGKNQAKNGGRCMRK